MMTQWLVLAAEPNSASQMMVAASDWTVRATIVLAAAAAAAWGLRRQSAALRHMIWVASVVSVLSLPVVAQFVPGFPFPTSIGKLFSKPPTARTDAPTDPRHRANERSEDGILGSGFGPMFEEQSSPDDMREDMAAAPLQTARGELKVTRGVSEDLRTAAVHSQTATGELSGNDIGSRFLMAISDLASVALRWWPIVWLTGAVVMLVPVLFGFVSLARLRRTSQPFPPNMERQLRTLAISLKILRPIRGRLSDSHVIPMTWGMARTNLLLPIEATSWDVERRRIVLLHELAHIARCDFSTQIVGQLMRAIHWFNPLAWFALSRLRMEQERACDDIVLNAGVAAEDYASELLSLTSRQPRSTWDVALALALSQYARLETRLKAILDAKQNRQSVPIPRRDLLVYLSFFVLVLISSAGRDAGQLSTGRNRLLSGEPPREAKRRLQDDKPGMLAIPNETGEPAVVYVAQAAIESEAGQSDATESTTFPPTRRFKRLVAADAAIDPIAEQKAPPAVEHPKPQPHAADSNPSLDQLQQTIQSFSAVAIDRNVLTEGAIKGMLSALEDDYSTVLTADQLSMITTGTSSIVGIGVQIEQSEQEERLIVVRAMPNSPAAKAGLRPKDEVLAVDDRPVTSLERAVQWIRGPEGRPVKLKLRRKEGGIEEITVVRAVVTNFVEPVVGLTQDDAGKWQYWLDGPAKIGYIHLTQFTGSAARQMAAVLTLLQKDGLKGVVLDLRGNIGGVIPDCVNVASMFLKQGVVARARQRDHEDESFVVSGQPEFLDLPLIVVIDGTTASAAEVLAGALRDHGRAVMVGERTFGKGSIQSIHPLGNSGSAIKLTTAYLFTPNGRKINHSADSNSWGIDPSDGWFVAMKDDDRKSMHRRAMSGGKLPDPLTPESVEASLHDSQLSAAWKALRGKLETGEFAKTGRSLDELSQQLTRRDELRRRRDELRQKLQLVEQELVQ